MKSGFLGIFVTFFVIVGAIVMGGGYGFFNVPALMICILPTIGLAYASSGGTDCQHAISALRCLLLKPKGCDLLNRNAQVLRHMISYCYAAGVIGTMIGWIQMLHNLVDPSSITIGFSVSILTVLYSIIISEFILRPAARRIEAEIEKKDR